MTNPVHVVFVLLFLFKVATVFGLMFNEAVIMPLVSDLKEFAMVLLKHKVQVAAEPPVEYEKCDASVLMVD